MSTGVPQGRVVKIHTFRGDRGRIGRTVRRTLEDEKNGTGPGPSELDCLLYTGHASASTDSDSSIYGFHPRLDGLLIWEGMERLRNGDSLPGVVKEDTQVFVEAKNRRLKVQTFEVVLPEPAFYEFEQRLGAERMSSRFTYGFPNGDGDCNCITWLERLALPLLSGSMDEFLALSGFRTHPRRRFGKCK